MLPVWGVGASQCGMLVRLSSVLDYQEAFLKGVLLPLHLAAREH